MRVIDSCDIAKKVYQLCLDINFNLRRDILKVLRTFLPKTKGVSRQFLKALIDNAAVAKKKKIALCQDTGMVVIFLEIGKDTVIRGSLFKEVSGAVESAYKEGFLRASVVSDPIYRGRPKFSPPILHIEYTDKKASYLTVLAKGFGSENKTKLFMLLPTDGEERVVGLVLEAIVSAGADSCPPFVVGVGIGGTSDKAVYLAKKAITLPITGKYRGCYYKLSKRIFSEANRLKIGVLGLGEGPTVLGVNILSYPTHIAGMPVAVNIGCHSTRSKTVKL